MARRKKSVPPATSPDVAGVVIESNGVSAQIADTPAAPDRKTRRTRKPKEPSPATVAGDQVVNVPHCVSAAEVATRKIEYLLEGYIPFGAVTLLVGPSHVGKTTLMAALAADVTIGTRMDGGGYRNPASVLWYVAEESVGSMTKPKLLSAGAVLGKTWFPGYDARGLLKERLALPGDFKKLRHWIEAKQARVVFFDPLNSFTGDGFDMNKSDHVRPMMEALGQLADELNVAMVASLHLRKDRSGSPLEWIAGSAAWHQTVRVALALGSDPETPSKKVLTVAKFALGPWPASRRYDLKDENGRHRFTLRGETKLGAEDLVASVRDAGDRDATADARMFLRWYLQDGEKPVKEVERIAEDNGIKYATLRRAKILERVDSVRIGPNATRYIAWKMPEGGFTPEEKEP